MLNLLWAMAYDLYSGGLCESYFIHLTTLTVQFILNVAARLIGGIQEFAYSSGFIRGSLHWIALNSSKLFPV